MDGSKTTAAHYNDNEANPGSQDKFRRAISLACLIGVFLCALFILVEIVFKAVVSSELIVIFAGMLSTFSFVQYKNEKSIDNLVIASLCAVICVVFMVRFFLAFGA